jgi:hypothetical protein
VRPLSARRKIVKTSNSADQHGIEKKSDTVTRRVSGRERERPSGRGRKGRRKESDTVLGRKRESKRPLKKVLRWARRRIYVLLA